VRNQARAHVAEPPVDDWWTDVEDDVLRCFDGRGAIPPSEIAAKLGISEAAVTSLLVMMAQEGKVRIRLVSGGGRGRGR
jgi:predicted ArsR family transcriptional regulator